ncbi:unnamed protein product [Vitrella brassicaformis CCMP3155]|uniref:Carboxylesterase type B domain-containing protein n=1 Tax=Vitrella brassicaformis (strain CCMP3155) TaxID=1169540 RepID=A0A0G4FF49_VITBC|nr:unnamed protein product [Vitrella brassicaformis CCMP3155]|eukprot:CEM11815.1 unnamed protein product [Vitrella brassicaformis CCMP3155]
MLPSSFTLGLRIVGSLFLTIVCLPGSRGQELAENLPSILEDIDLTVDFDPFPEVNITLADGRNVTVTGRCLRQARSVPCTPISGVDAFFGVPYATAERFKFPEPFPFPEDAFNATDPAPGCISLCKFVGRNPYLCGTAGEGFITGSASAPVNIASGLADGIRSVVVTYEYRLGVLGFLPPVRDKEHHHHKKKPDKDKDKDKDKTDPKESHKKGGGKKGDASEILLPGNYGFMDSVAALKFIQQTVGNFTGGRSEPGLTLWGFSNGAKLAACHLTSPTTAQNGLDIRRVLLSSGSWGLPLIPQEDAKKVVKVALKAIKSCKRKDFTDGQEYVACLRRAPIEEIRKADELVYAVQVADDFFRVTENVTPTPGTPEIPDECFQALLDGKYNESIPFIVTTNNNEGTLYRRTALASADEVTQYIGQFDTTPLVANPLTYSSILEVLLGLPKALAVLSKYPWNGDDVYPGEPANRGEFPESADAGSSLSSAIGDYVFSCPARGLCGSLKKCFLAYYVAGWSSSEAPQILVENPLNPAASYGLTIGQFCDTDGVRCHLEELPWVLRSGVFFLTSGFGILEGQFTFTPDERQARTTLYSYVRNFIASDDPNVGLIDVPQWPQYVFSTKGDDPWQALSILDADLPPDSPRAETRPGYKREFCNLWDKVNPRYSTTWKGLKKAEKKDKTDKAKAKCGGKEVCKEGQLCVPKALAAMGVLRELWQSRPVQVAAYLSLKGLTKGGDGHTAKMSRNVTDVTDVGHDNYDEMGELLLSFVTILSSED